ncbi:MAG: type 2 isopentenyl-diphosphate Delta-isomerase [Rhodothermales bacterium]
MQRDRKAEHIKLSLDPRVQSDHHFFDDYVFEHVALPEINFDEIDITSSFLGKTLSSPLLISCMTGGTTSARSINENLALAAEEKGVVLGVGSQRKALEDAQQAHTFQIRALAPTIPILANLGAVQLNYGFGLEACEQAVAMVEADALVFHLNPLQEAIQPEGQCNFADLLPKMGEIAGALSVPVIVKEIGSGISGDLAARIQAQGISIIDTAGTGGTSWARIEAARANDTSLGELFAHWGIPTPQSIIEVSKIEGLTIIGSGGIRSGLDAAKAIALGADLVGMAAPFLAPAMESADAVRAAIDAINKALKIAMFCVGARTLAELQQTPVYSNSNRGL